MSDPAVFPLWAVYLLAFGSPLLVFLAASVGHILTRRTAKELEKRSQREELMTTLRWAAELAVSADPREAALGTKELIALRNSEFSTADTAAFIDAALDSVVAPVEAEVEDYADAEVEIADGSLDDRQMSQDTAALRGIDSGPERDTEVTSDEEEDLRDPGAADGRSGDR